MQKVIITFAGVGPVNGFVIDIKFKIRYFKDQKGFQKDIIQDSWLKISITHFALIGWGLVDNVEDIDLIKIAFPFAINLISEKVKDGTLKEYEEQIISREDNLFPYPFDIKKIDKIEGFELVFPENDEDIGKRIQTNLIADSIIELRDNINALVYSKEKEILLKLSQERNILNLYRRIDNREQFSHAISTLGNLVNDLNIDLLRNITGNKDPKTKSLGLLEEFLATLDKEPSEIMEIFRTINRIRQGFPIHTDKTEIVKNLKKFRIDYPIVDHNAAWQIMIDKYKIGLSELMLKIKKYVG